MTSANFLTALEFTLKWEGKVTEDVPGDPGGKTKWGITAADDATYRREHGLPPLDVFRETPDVLSLIYQAHYWSPVHGDALPYPLSLVLFDSAVNVGLGRAVVWLQEVLGVTADGAFGPATLAAAQNYIVHHGAVPLAAAILTRRDAYYNSIGAPGKSLHKFLAGWLARTADLHKTIGA